MTANVNCSRRKWTKEEDVILAELWLNTPIGSICKIMNRARVVVYQNVKRLELQRSPNYVQKRGRPIGSITNTESQKIKGRVKSVTIRPQPGVIIHRAK